MPADAAVHVLPSFFDASLADRVHDHLSNDASWYYAFSDISLPDVAQNAPYIAEAKARAEARHGAGQELAYRFRRTIEHEGTSDCGCPVCDACRTLTSEETLRRIEQATGFEDLKRHTMFASCYTGGDFLSTHSDGGLGRVAFVWNLTKSWATQWGGVLQLLQSDGRSVDRTIVPEFNSLALFDVSGSGRPHVVSPVGNGVTARRLAVTGWFA